MRQQLWIYDNNGVVVIPTDNIAAIGAPNNTPTIEVELRAGCDPYVFRFDSLEERDETLDKMAQLIGWTNDN